MFQIGLILCLVGIIVHVGIKASRIQAAKAKQHSSNSISLNDNYQNVPLLSESESEEHEVFSR